MTTSDNEAMLSGDKAELPVAAKGVDGQVLLAASEMNSRQKANPEWLWYAHADGMAGFGRWNARADAAPYIRGDLIAAPSAFAEGIEAAAKVAGAQEVWCNGTNSTDPVHAFNMGAAACREAIVASIRALSPPQEVGEPSEAEVEADNRYPSMFYNDDGSQRVGVAHYHGQDGPDAYVSVKTLLENKPGGAWVVVHLSPDEAEQMALHLLQKVKSCRSALAAAKSRTAKGGA